MRTLLWITTALTLYSTPMTVDYTADGYSVLIDPAGYEWEYDTEISGDKVNVLISNNGTPDIEDDIIIAIEEVNEL